MTASPLRRRMIAMAALAALALVLLAGCDDEPPTAPPVPDTPLASLTIAPATDTLSVGETLVFSVAALDTDSVAVVQPPVRWSSSNTGVASVSGAGVLSAHGIGTVNVIASYGGRADTAIIVVVPGPGWVALTTGVSDRLDGVCFLPDGRTGWVVGAAGLVLETDDGGYSWRLQRPTTFDLNAVWSNGSTVVAVGDGGTVIVRDVAGGAWTRPTSFATENLYGVHFVGATGWAVGSSGAVIRSVDGGVSWSRIVPTRTANTLRAVRFAGALEGWAVGDQGTVLGSHDGGLTWHSVTPTLTAQDLRGVSRATVAQAIAVGALGTVLRTVAGPDSVEWGLDAAPVAWDVEAVANPAAAGPVGFAVGFDAGALVARTDDAGDSWERQVIANTLRLRDVFFLDERRGWVVGDQGRAYVTGTGGR